MEKIPGCEGKRKLEEESAATEEKPFVYVRKTFIGEDGEEYYDSDDDYISYADGRKVCIRLQKEYARQFRESEGFDITLDLELKTRFNAYVNTHRGHENKNPVFLDLAHKSIEHFNAEHNTNYKFVKNITVNSRVAAGIQCYITLLATDMDADDPDDPNASKTFQASAWWGVDKKTKVRFCRLKKEGMPRTVSACKQATYILRRLSKQRWLIGIFLLLINCKLGMFLIFSNITHPIQASSNSSGNPNQMAN